MGGSLKRFRVALKGLGVDVRPGSSDPYENYMAVSINWGPFCGHPHNKSPTLWGWY